MSWLPMRFKSFENISLILSLKNDTLFYKKSFWRMAGHTLNIAAKYTYNR
jgi:hypothetical protein